MVFDAGDRNKSSHFLHSSVFLWGISIALVTGLGGVSYLWQLGTVGLVDETEPLFAEAARQMVVTGDWITPYFNGETRFDKPPLIYWLMAIAYQLVGVNEWGVRLPSALSAISVVVLVAFSLLKFGYRSGFSRGDIECFEGDLSQRTSEQVLPPADNWSAAWLGACIVALTPLIVAWGRTGVSDMLLTACMTGSMLSFFNAYACQGNRSKQRCWYFAFYTFIGLGILTKGPVAIVLPGLAIVAFLLFAGRLVEVLREALPVRGVVTIAALTVPWFLAVSTIHGSDYIDTFFGYHNFERFTSVVNKHSAPWYFYFLIVLGGFAPFSFELPGAIGQLQVWRLGAWRQQSRPYQLGLFAFWWFISIFGFFTVSVTKLPSYILPLLPAAAIMVALLWSDRISSANRTSELTQTKPSIGMWIQTVCNILFFVALAIGSLMLTSFLGADSSAPDLPEAIQAAHLPLLGGVIWGTTAIVAVGLVFTNRLKWLCLANTGGMLACVIVVVSVAFPLMDGQRQLPLRQLSWLAAEEIQSNEPMLMIGFMKPSVTFYMRQNVQYLSGRSQFERALNPENAANPIPSALLLGETDVFDDFGLGPNTYETIAEAGAYRLARLR